MRSRTNIFLVNLSIADLGMAIFNCVPSFIFMRDRLVTFFLLFSTNNCREWVFGSFLCSFCQFTSYLTISLSVFTLLGITMERYKAIMKPLAPRSSQMTFLSCLVIIWGVSAFISLPPAIFSKLIKTQ